MPSLSILKTCSTVVISSYYLQKKPVFFYDRDTSIDLSLQWQNSPILASCNDLKLELRLQLRQRLEEE